MNCVKAYKLGFVLSLPTLLTLKGVFVSGITIFAQAFLKTA